jgi:endonuclease I
MKRICPRQIVTALFLAWIIPASAQSAILISELCDPRLNYATDRFIEIYNSGSESVDLTGWSLVAVGNGGDIFTWPLSGLIGPGEALVAGDATTVTVFPVDFADEAWSSSNGLWNGKVGDGAKLVGPGGIVDYVVVTGTAFENRDYARNYAVITPNTVYTPSEWTGRAVDLATDGSPGTHDAAAPVPGPSISDLHTDPALPEAGEAVHVLAEVTDSTSPVASVVLLWGDAPSSLPNEIAMSLTAGDTYRTDELIPSQSEGATVYYRVRATNDVSGTTLSDLERYSIAYRITIHEVQGEASSSPYAENWVITHGIVTAGYASYFVMQDRSGAWNGIWVESAAEVSVGDSVAVRGRVTEAAGLGFAGNTMLVDAVVLGQFPGASLPEAVIVPTGSLSSEGYEGVLVKMESAVCTNPDLGLGEWAVDDGSGEARVDDLGYAFAPTLGTAYDVVGPVAFYSGRFKVQPRDENDVLWVADDYAPVIVRVSVTSDTTVLVVFSEEVEAASAGTLGNYGIEDLDVRGATRDEARPWRVFLTVSVLSPGDYTLAVDGVEDLFGNPALDEYSFHVVVTGVPAGYYDGAEGEVGEALRAALHEIIKNHTVQSYDYAWIAFRTTDCKPEGKVWDIYSDVPGGIPPYEYTFGVDEGGTGGEEGGGYTREHSWPRSWFGGEVSPMNSDLFALYPCDAHVNGNRGNYPYGETASPEWTSLNGSRKGLCSYPGYTGLVFEPIDEYKGDLARTYFYMCTRYYSEDAAWPGSPMTDGADLLPWKEITRNAAVYALQGNRNPFIDRPEYADWIWASTGVSEHEPRPTFVLHQNTPNPFNPATTISFSLPARMDVDLAVYDVNGRLVQRLASGSFAGGSHRVEWCGRDAAGRDMPSGIYFARLRAGEFTATRKMVLLE